MLLVSLRNWMQFADKKHSTVKEDASLMMASRAGTHYICLPAIFAQVFSYIL